MLWLFLDHFYHGHPRDCYPAGLTTGAFYFGQLVLWATSIAGFVKKPLHGEFFLFLHNFYFIWEVDISVDSSIRYQGTSQTPRPLRSLRKMLQSQRRLRPDVGAHPATRLQNTSATCLHHRGMIGQQMQRKWKGNNEGWCNYWCDVMQHDTSCCRFQESACRDRVM